MNNILPNQAIAAAPAYIAGVNKIENSSKQGGWFFNLMECLNVFEHARHFGENLVRPSGNQLREYLANTVAIVQSYKNDDVKDEDGNDVPITFTVRVVEVVPVQFNGIISSRPDAPAGVPVRELFVVDGAVLTENLASAWATAELVAAGWNLCRVEIIRTTRAECHEAKLIIAAALKEVQAAHDIKQQVEKDAADSEVCFAPKVFAPEAAAVP